MENPCGPSLFQVCVVGVGSVGQCVLRSLPDAKDMCLTLIDGDTVEAHNIGRQPLCTSADVGLLKVDVARQRLSVQSPDIQVKGLSVFLDANGRVIFDQGTANGISAGANVTIAAGNQIVGNATAATITRSVDPLIHPPGTGRRRRGR